MQKNIPATVRSRLSSLYHSTVKEILQQTYHVQYNPIHLDYESPQRKTQPDDHTQYTIYSVGNTPAPMSPLRSICDPTVYTYVFLFELVLYIYLLIHLFPGKDHLVRFTPLTDVVNNPSTEHTYMLYLYFFSISFLLVLEILDSLSLWTPELFVEAL